MKRILFFLLFSGLYFTCRAGFPSNQQGITFTAGYFQGNFSSLNDHMKLLGMQNGFPSAFRTVGIGYFGTVGGRNAAYGDGIMNFEFAIPQEINQGDSLKFRMTGCHFISSIFGFDLLQGSDAIAFVVAPGIDWGKFWMKRTMEGQNQNYSNFYLAPLARTEFRVVFWKIALGVRATYRYDITNSRWKSGSVHDLGGTKFSGLGFQVYIGWGEITPL